MKKFHNSSNSVGIKLYNRSSISKCDWILWNNEIRCKFIYLFVFYHQFFLKDFKFIFRLRNKWKIDLMLLVTLTAISTGNH